MGFRQSLWTWLPTVPTRHVYLNTRLSLRTAPTTCILTEVTRCGEHDEGNCKADFRYRGRLSLARRGFSDLWNSSSGRNQHNYLVVAFEGALFHKAVSPQKELRPHGKS